MAHTHRVLYPSAIALASELAPTEPVTLVRPAAAKRAARYFLDHFPGKTLYAVKANPSPELLEALWDGGVTHYDVASINEVRRVAQTLPGAVLCFMHPVKSPEAIAEAYFIHGVRSFSLDSLSELDKIVAATKAANDLNLLVRLRASSEHSKLSLSSKFGARPEDAAALLMATRQVADALGICFHVGSQAMSPQAYADALIVVRDAIVRAGVTVDIVDVGGGFPSSYPGMMAETLDPYIDVIREGFEALPVSYSAELWCEPGRALSAEYASVLVRVESRKDDLLYINDGAYGSLFDAAHVGWRYPMKLLRDSKVKPWDFSLYGPTCDDMDFMKGPFALPADIQAGDYIEIGMLGAYGASMRTDFNGFRSDATFEVTDEPMYSLYRGVEQKSAVAPVHKIHVVE
jgi:ornithine decarboxylase